MPIDAIVFVHQGANRYLPMALAQACKANPGRRIILLGDASNADAGHLCSPGGNSGGNSGSIEHHAAWQPDKATQALASTYIHSSGNPAAAEIACLERWFVLARFCRAQAIKSVLYVDSDVMIFSDMLDASCRFADCDFTLSYGICGHASYWNDISVLEGLCDFILSTYGGAQSAGLIAKLESFGILSEAEIAHGISDMTMLKLFAKRHEGKVGETTDVIDGTTFDNNISFPDHGAHQFQMHRGAKRLHWKNGQPFGTVAGSGQAIRFDLLHCQGIGKMYMANLLANRSPVDVRGVAVERALFEARKVTPQWIRAILK